MHPLISIDRVSGPTDDPIFAISVRYPDRIWNFNDRLFSSVAEAEAAVPELQATRRIPTDAELTDEAGRAL